MDAAIPAAQSSGRRPWGNVAGPLGFETRRTPVGR